MVVRSRVLRALPSAMLTGVAMTTAVAVGGLAATAPESVSTAPVELSALVVAGSSTNPTGEGVENFFQGRYNTSGTDIERVNFFAGASGIHSALVGTPETDVLLSSGWGAANASALLSWYALTDPASPVLTENLWVLDNNVARPNGGWGTRYPTFALIGVNPIPTPAIEGVRVTDVGYQYDANSNAPAYYLNLIAGLNSLVAYVQVRLNQDQLYLPVLDDGSIVDADGQQFDRSACESTCTVRVGVHPGGTPRLAEVKVVGDSTYVTYLTNGLPLVQPLKAFGPGGAALAAAIEPALTVLVNAGYPDNNPTANPDRYVPGTPLPPPAVVTTAAQQLPGAIQEGIDSLSGADAQTAVTKPKPSSPQRETTPRHWSGLDLGTRTPSDVDVADDDVTSRRPRRPITTTAGDAEDRIGTRPDPASAPSEQTSDERGLDSTQRDRSEDPR